MYLTVFIPGDFYGNTAIPYPAGCLPLCYYSFRTVKNIRITKASGARAYYAPRKLRRSLRRAGAPADLIRDIEAEIEREVYPGMSTSDIYARAFQLLHGHSSHLAARYKLKKAIMELGPSGYPFEHFVGALISHTGFRTQVGVFLEGRCVSHEVDVKAVRHQEKILVECKYHNQSGFICDVKISLYVHARFRDIEAGMEGRGEDPRFEGWIVTNTRFSDDALRYGTCAGMRLVSWDYPAKGSLKDMIDREKLYPLTCLTTLSGREKELLLKQGLVLCRELLSREDALRRARVSATRIPGVLQECNELCGTGK